MDEKGFNVIIPAFSFIFSRIDTRIYYAPGAVCLPCLRNKIDLYTVKV